MSYYYLIAGLPNLSLDKLSKGINFFETFELIYNNLLPDDRVLFQYLIYPNDIKNLLSLLFKKYHDLLASSFLTPSIIEKEDLDSYKITKGSFPDFMNQFLLDHEDHFSSMNMREMENAIHLRFQEEVRRLGSDFLSTYFHFSEKLRSFTASFLFNRHDFLSAPNTLDAEKLIAQLKPGRALTKSMSTHYPYSEELILTLSQGEPEKIEQCIDQILWDFLEEESGRDGFGCDKVLAYTLQLQMTQRRVERNIEQGEEVFTTLLEQITNNVRSPNTPVI